MARTFWSAAVLPAAKRVHHSEIRPIQGWMLASPYLDRELEASTVLEHHGDQLIGIRPFRAAMISCSSIVRLAAWTSPSGRGADQRPTGR